MLIVIIRFGIAECPLLEESKSFSIAIAGRSESSFVMSAFGRLRPVATGFKRPKAAFRKLPMMCVRLLGLSK